MTHESVVRAYYRHIDAAAYDDLAALLAPEFVHERPDQTLSGRETFVRFMREERPRTDTEHAVDAVYVPADGEDDTGHDEGDLTEIVARGRLLAETGEELFGFVDVFRVDADDALTALQTYTD
ncbi:nuclear transport factor 2 family protein [Halobaculum limi]|uniref:nuclear transport factor 2 family protein n=1 Tax=Halobaculum limi TaxID=3031916 RepID=UPI003D8106A3